MVRATTTTLTTTDENSRRRPQALTRSTTFTAGSSAFEKHIRDLKDLLPVFIFPHVLFFYANESRSLTQEVKLYNPYDWPIKFKVFATVPQRWDVSDPEGIITPKWSVEMTITLTNTDPSLIGKEDHLRFVIKSDESVAKLGKRDVPCLFLAKRGSQDEQILRKFFSALEEDNFALHPTVYGLTPPPIRKPKEKADSKPIVTKNNAQGANENKSKTTSNWPPSFYIIIAIICGIIMCLPTAESRFAAYLSVSYTMKFIAAYVLGIITSLLCKYY